MADFDPIFLPSHHHLRLPFASHNRALACWLASAFVYIYRSRPQALVPQTFKAPSSAHQQVQKLQALARLLSSISWLPRIRATSARSLATLLPTFELVGLHGEHCIIVRGAAAHAEQRVTICIGCAASCLVDGLAACCCLALEATDQGHSYHAIPATVPLTVPSRQTSGTALNGRARARPVESTAVAVTGTGGSSAALSLTLSDISNSHGRGFEHVQIFTASPWKRWYSLKIYYLPDWDLVN
ncbi:hypothetical protein B0H17DRAFT_1123860 [Mycena rosella]|uniref:Uncharacterized protein n=1 Tax=Mycena rosella TaxID=1033263 RepID=A0AAD7H357_MYCRO|nr:hypothetical protein B0H17DRAFT_1123860 [Mycena rosella]